MRFKEWSNSTTCRTYHTKPYKSVHPKEHAFTDRQELIPGFVQAILTLSEVIFIGAGGLNCWSALGLVQAGIRKILLCDRDRLEASNCNRQFYPPGAVGQYKVHALGEGLSRLGAGETTIVSYPYHFEEMLVLYGTDVFATTKVAVIGVDNEESRVAASKHFRALSIPAIFSGVSVDGKTGFVFVQASSPDSPCYGCAYPRVVTALSEQSLEAPCPRTPAMSPILHALSGLTLEALFAVLMPGLFHDWNYFYLCIDGSLPTGGSVRARNPDCPLCAPPQEAPQTCLSACGRHEPPSAGAKRSRDSSGRST
jgi:molybdopterin/thiamine biosynthesis adenylyltransferase